MELETFLFLVSSVGKQDHVILQKPEVGKGSRRSKTPGQVEETHSPKHPAGHQEE